MQTQRLVGMFSHPLLQCRTLIEEELIGQLRIAHRIVARGRAELVVLHQPVIRVLREGHRRQFKRIDQRQGMQRQHRVQRLQRRPIEGDDVVPKYKCGTFGHAVKALNEILRRPGYAQARIGVRPEGTDFLQRQRIVPRGFNIEAQAPGPRCIRLISHRDA